MSSSTLPTTTSGITIAKTGGVEVLEYKTDLPVPELKDGQILVKNEYIGVNFIDTYFRTGLYPAPSFPYTLGREASGTVLAVAPHGNTHGLHPGDRIAYIGETTYAAATAAAALYAARLPAGVTTRDGAASLLQGVTALTLVREAYAAQRGEWVLVHAAAGGTGQWLVRLLSKLVGARVIATAGGKEKGEVARALGAEVVVDYKAEGADWVKRVMEVTGGEGVAGVYDGVGKDTFDGDLEVVARKGTVVSFGNASGAVEPLNLLRLGPKCVKVARPVLFGYMRTREEFERYSGELFTFMEKEGVKPHVHEIYPLKEAARAHVDLEERKTLGKLLLQP